MRSPSVVTWQTHKTPHTGKEAAITIGESFEKHSECNVGASVESEVLSIHLVYGKKLVMQNQTEGEYEKHWE